MKPITQEKQPNLSKVITQGHGQAQQITLPTVEFPTLGRLGMPFWSVILTAGEQIQRLCLWEKGIRVHESH